MTFNEMIIPGLTFKKDELTNAANNEENTTIAWIFIIVLGLINAIFAYFNGNGGSSGFGGLEQTGINAFFIEILSLLIGTVFQIYMLYVVVKYLFKAEATFNGTLRTFGAVFVWKYIALILGFIIPASFGALVGIGLWLVFNIALLIALMGYSKLVVWKSFLSIVLAFAASFIGLIIAGIILEGIL